MLALQLWDFGAEPTQEHFIFTIGEPADFLLPALRLCQFGVCFLHLVAKLIVHELVKKRLRDDLELIAIITESIIGAHALERVDQLFGLRCEILCCG